MKTREAHWYHLAAARMSRRDFVRIGRDVAGIVALGSLGACRADRSAQLAVSPFPSGVASGDPDAGGMVLWTRLSGEGMREAGLAAEPVAVRWEVAADESFARIVR